MDPESLRAAFRSARARAERLYTALDDDGFRRRPRPGSWSVAGCLEHLCLAGEAWLPALDAALAPGARRSGPLARLEGAVLVRLVEPPARPPLPAPSGFRPSVGAGPPDPTSLVTRFLSLQDALCARVEAAGRAPAAERLVVSPVHALMRMDLAHALAFLAAHQRRHLDQADRALAAAGGRPRSSGCPLPPAPGPYP